ncbi:unnamed protein product [Protopolystoma xenopodis]|uniref:Uncharacterized protein n=1 Tax=Protopolystoma xenopodis TaxID=117903 RepID=A0A448X998_9PLAT|nr:unnamed protein product [Protopolystoma xenopodis]
MTAPPSAGRPASRTDGQTDGRTDGQTDGRTSRGLRRPANYATRRNQMQQKRSFIGLRRRQSAGCMSSRPARPVLTGPTTAPVTTGHSRHQ